MVYRDGKGKLAASLKELGTVTKASLADQVVSILKLYILFGDLKKGDQLPSERELIVALDISHRVAREALTILAEQGLAERIQGRGSFLKGFDRNWLLSDCTLPPVAFSDTWQLVLTRCAFEVGVMPLVAARITDDELDTLHASLLKQRQLVEDGESLTREDARFHRLLVQATHDDMFQSIVQSSLFEVVFFYPGLLGLQDKSDHDILHEHEAILETLHTGDGNKAMLAMRQHMDAYFKTFRI